MDQNGTKSTTYQNSEEPIIFRQMEYDTDGCFYGLMFLFAGLLFFGVAIVAISNGSYGAFPGVVISLLVIGFSLPLVCSYLTQVRITEKEVCLYLGPFAIKRIAIPDIRTLAYSTMTPNIRGEPWTAQIIYLSVHPPTHIRYVARRWVTEEEVSGISDPIEKEAVIMRKSAERYFRACTSGFHLTIPEGIWLEYAPERVAIIKNRLPDAADLINDILR